MAGRAVHTATALADGSVLMVGGCIVDGCTTASASTVLLAVDQTTEADSLAEARDAHTATLLETGRVFVAGGFSGEGEPPLGSTEIFDPKTGRWVAGPHLTLGRGGHAAARLGDGRVVEVGGWISPRRYTATTEVYDPTTEQFLAGPALPVAADGLSATSLADGSILVTGGQVEPGVATAAATVIAADGKSAHPVGPLGRARFKHTMVALPSGDVLVIGGTSDDRELLDSTEVYDPQTGRFSAGPTMSAGRYKLSGEAAVLPDGRVVVAGGGPGVEIIDPARRTSRRVRGTGPGRASFSTVSVLDGTIRVIGGYDRAIRLTRTDLSIPFSKLRPRAQPSR